MWVKHKIPPSPSNVNRAFPAALYCLYKSTPYSCAAPPQYPTGSLLLERTIRLGVGEGAAEEVTHVDLAIKVIGQSGRVRVCNIRCKHS